MTLIIAHSSPDAQFLVADRLITRAGKPEKDDAYKIFQYVNFKQGYAFGASFCGHARVQGKHTIDWMMDMLQMTMPPEQDIGKGLAAFCNECTNSFPRLFIRRIPTTFVFSGRYHAYLPIVEPPCPFVAIVSDSVDDHGRQTNAVANSFKLLKWSRRHYDAAERPTTTICRGDQSAALKHRSALTKIMKRLRTDMSAERKIRLAVQFIRLVANSSTTVGHDVLCLCLNSDGTSVGGDFPRWRSRVSRTMPHFVEAGGARMTYFLVTCDAGFVED